MAVHISICEKDSLLSGEIGPVIATATAPRPIEPPELINMPDGTTRPVMQTIDTTDPFTGEVVVQTVIVQRRARDPKA
jgi:hypothetical protein